MVNFEQLFPLFNVQALNTLDKMDKIAKPNTGKSTINFEAFYSLKEKSALIDFYILRGKEVPDHLTKNFVTFPLSDNPEIE